MEKLFGIPMSSIMVALLIAFGLCIGVGGWVLLRQRIIFRMGMRNVPRRPTQTTLIVIGLMLSTLIIAAALTTGDTLNYSVKATVYDTLQRVDELVVPVSGDAKQANPQPGVTFPQQVATDLARSLSGNADVAGVAPVLAEPVPAINPRTKLSEPLVTAVGVDPVSLAPFGGLNDVDGKAIDLGALGENEIVLGKTAADKLDGRVGDVLTIYVNNQPHELQVAAIAPDTALTGMQGTGSAGGFAMPLSRAQTLFNAPGKVSYIAIANKGGVETGADLTDSVVSAVDGALQGTPYKAVPVKQRALDQAEQAGNAFTSIFLVLGLFSIAAGILLIFLIFVLLAAERKPEMGMARAVGMRRRQLTQMFLAEGIAYDLVSALVGAALGVGVAMVIAGIMSRLIGEFITIRAATSWQSLIIAYTLGVVVTFITIAVSSWRVSRLNIVRAIRDIPEPQRQRASRRWLIFGILGAVVGALLIMTGSNSHKLFPFSMGISLVPLSLAVALRRFGLPARLLYTVASLLVLAFWLSPPSLNDRLWGKLDGGMEMFFVSGIMMVAAATIAIVWNAEIGTGIIGFFGRTFSRWLPAVKTAVAYPLASKGRTGMTIALFSLIIFSLVMVATIDSNFSAIFSGDQAAGGWNISATQAPTNPIPDFTKALADNGVDTSKITAVGQLNQVPAYAAQVRMAGTDEWKQYQIDGTSADFIDNADMPLQTRASGYDSDKAVWDAVRDNPDLAVVDGFATYTQGMEAGGNATFKLTGVTQGDKIMQPAKIEIGNAATGATREVTVIGVVDQKVSMIQGIYVNEQAFSQVYARPNLITYYLKTQPGTDDATFAKAIRAGLITYGVQAASFKELIDQQTSTSRGFLLLIEGFMALGLVVGIAALGVISFRSVVERRQQIGMLRAIGYQRAMVAASFLMESTMITVLGVASGAILGLILARNLMTSEDFTGTTGSTTFIVPWLTIGIFMVIALGAALLMAYIPARKAASVPIAEALRYE